MRIAIQEVKEQLVAENAKLSIATMEAENLICKMQQVVNTEEIQGEAYGNIKDYYETMQIPLVKALICMYAEKISANNNYFSALSTYFGNMKDIDQTVINERMLKIRFNRQVLESMLLGEYIYKEYIESMYNFEQELYRQIQKVEDFNQVTAGLYNEFYNKYNLVEQGITYAKCIQYNGKGHYINLSVIDTLWNSQIHNLYEDSREHIEKIKNDSIYAQIKEYARQWDIEIGRAYWSWADIAYWKTIGGNEHLSEQKENFVYTYRDVIKDAANKYDIPEFLLAGVTYMEYGGDPYVLDDGGYIVRRFFNDIVGMEDNSNDLTKNAYLTSFGNVSIQVRRIAETLGMDVNNMTEEQKNELISMAKDPVANLYIVAKHLSDLKNIDYPNVETDSLSQEQIIVIATRYNRGPDLTLDEIKANMTYGVDMYGHQVSIERGLYGAESN